MNRKELEKVTKSLIKILIKSGYTSKESGDILELVGQTIKEVRDEKSK